MLSRRLISASASPLIQAIIWLLALSALMLRYRPLPATGSRSASGAAPMLISVCYSPGRPSRLIRLLTLIAARRRAAIAETPRISAARRYQSVAGLPPHVER